LPAGSLGVLKRVAIWLNQTRHRRTWRRRTSPPTLPLCRHPRPCFGLLRRPSPAPPCEAALRASHEDPPKRIMF